MNYARTSSQATVATAVQHIGKLFSEYDFCLWMAYLHGDKFKGRMTAVRFSILATPASAVELRRSYEQTRRILEVHACGLAMLSVMGRAKLHWDGDNFATDWEGVDPLPEMHIKEWGTAVRYIVEDLRFVVSLLPLIQS